MKILRMVLASIALSAFATSCAQIEKATAKWKTPEASSQTATTVAPDSAKPVTENAAATTKATSKKEKKKKKVAPVK